MKDRVDIVVYYRPHLNAFFANALLNGRKIATLCVDDPHPRIIHDLAAQFALWYGG